MIARLLIGRDIPLPSPPPPNSEQTIKKLTLACHVILFIVDNNIKLIQTSSQTLWYRYSKS